MTACDKIGPEKVRGYSNTRSASLNHVERLFYFIIINVVRTCIKCFLKHVTRVRQVITHNYKTILVLNTLKKFSIKNNSNKVVMNGLKLVKKVKSNEKYGLLNKKNNKKLNFVSKFIMIDLSQIYETNHF